jgi:hypothetical protein
VTACSVAGAAQHSTAVIEMSVSHCFAAHSVAGSAGESRRTVSSCAVDTATALSRACVHVCSASVSLSGVCLEPASNIHRLSFPMRRALRPNNLRHACTLFFSASRIPEDHLGLLALSLMLSAQHGDRLQASRQKIGEGSTLLLFCVVRLAAVS